MNKKFIENVKEFLRSVLVSIASLLVDTSALITFQRFIFNHDTEKDLFLSTAAGFISGLILSYCLSFMFVFKNSKKKDKSAKEKIKDFIIFAIISLTGLGLTELGMYSGVYLLSLNYVLTKLVVAALVHVWNYCLRKLFIFK